MANHDYVIDNQTFPATRTDLNNPYLLLYQTTHHHQNPQQNTHINGGMTHLQIL